MSDSKCDINSLSEEHFQNTRIISVCNVDKNAECQIINESKPHSFKEVQKFIDMEVSDSGCAKFSLTENEMVESEDWQLPLDQVLSQEFPVSYETCLAINQAYQMILEEYLHRIDLKLAENSEKQTALKRELDENLKKKQHTNVLANKRSRPLTIYIMPYFKDRQGMSAPANEDAILKKNEKDPYILPSKLWAKREEQLLVVAVKKSLLRQYLKPFLAKQEFFSEKLINADLSDTEIDELKNKIKEIDFEIKKNSRISDEELRKSHKGADIDWLMISSLDFDGQRSPMECQLYWQNKLHPSINNSPWMKDERKKLKRWVDIHNQNWVVISKSLDTQRSPFDCAHHYQSTLNENVTKRKWTLEEDAFLLAVVESCQVGSYIPWNHVTYFMEGRSRIQVWNRWSKALDPSIKKGKWSELEDMMLIAAIKKYGAKDWKRIKDYVPGRTDVQCRDRWSNSLDVNTKIGHWTTEEDEIIIKLVEQFGLGKWAKVASHLPGRTDAMVSQRYKTLKKGRLNYGKKCESVSLRHQILERRERLHKMIKDRISEITAAKMNFSVVDIIGKKTLETKQATVDSLRSTAWQRLATLKQRERQVFKRRAIKSKLEKTLDDNLLKLMKDRVTKRKTGRPRKYLVPEIKEKFSCHEDVYNEALKRLYTMFTEPGNDACPPAALSTLINSLKPFTVPVIPFLPPVYITMLGFKQLLLYKKQLTLEVNKLWKMPIIPQPVTVLFPQKSGCPPTVILNKTRKESNIASSRCPTKAKKDDYDYLEEELEYYDINSSEIDKLINEVLPPIRHTKQYNILKDQFLALFVWPALISNITPKPEKLVKKAKNLETISEDAIAKKNLYPCTSGKKYRRRLYKDRILRLRSRFLKPVVDATSVKNKQAVSDGSEQIAMEEKSKIKHTRKKYTKRSWFNKDELRPRSTRLTTTLIAN